MKMFVLILMVFSLPVPAVEMDKKKITLVYEVMPNPPFYLGEGPAIDWQKPGVTLELLKLLENKLNIQFEFKRRPWARGMREVKANVVDGIFHATFSEERLLSGVYPMKNSKLDSSRAIVHQSYFLYKHKDASIQWDGKSFTKINGSIGVVRGYVVVGYLKEMGIAVKEINSQLSGLRMLNAGRIVGLADIETVSDFQIKTHPNEFKDIVKVYPPLNQIPYYLVFSHKFVLENPDLTEAIWNTIKEIKSSPQYEQIVEKYL